MKRAEEVRSFLTEEGTDPQLIIPSYLQLSAALTLCI